MTSVAALIARTRSGSTPWAFREPPAPFPGNARLWHAKCSLLRRQARRQLNRDPAAITSLSVACRYASRPPSVPTINPAFQEPGRPGRVLPLLKPFLFPPTFSGHFSPSSAVAPRRQSVNALSHRRPSAATQRRAPGRHLDKICHSKGDDLRRFGPHHPTI